MSGRRRSYLSGRQLSVRVKTAKGRKPASTRWLTRQLNDPYVAEARRAGYRSRAAFKLIQLDDRFHFLKPGQTVLDLGAAPGGWTQVVSERVTAKGGGTGRVVAADILPMSALPGVEPLELDLRDAEALDRLREALGGPADVVLSDMSPSTTGHKATDHLRSMALCEAAHDIACRLLASGGTLVMKAFQGGTQQDLMVLLRRDFARVKHMKPEASRPESPEIYVVATGFRGGETATPPDSKNRTG